MGVISDNKYSFRAMPRSTRHWIITKDAKKEIDFVRECTKIALSTDPLDKPKDFDSEDDSFEF